MKRFLLIVCISLLGLGLRLAPLTVLVDSWGVHLYGFDSYYHLRRAAGLASGFSMAERDHWTAYPQGGRCHWPRMYDWLLSLFLRLPIWGSLPLEGRAAAFPLLLGMLNALSVLWFVEQRLNRPNLAVLSFGLLSIMPAHLRVSALGNADHHLFELFMTTLLWCSVIESHRIQRSVFPNVLAGILLGMCQLAWRGALLLGPLVFIVQIIIITISDTLPRKQKLVDSVVIFITAALVYLGGALYGDVDITRITFWELSLFQVLLFVALAVPFVMGLVYSRWAGRGALVVLGLLCLIVFSFCFATPELSSTVEQGFQFLIGSHTWRGTISESIPLFQAPEVPPWPLAAALFSLLFYVSPLLIIHCSVIFFQSREKPIWLLVMLVWGTAFILMALRQQRYAHQVVIPLTFIVLFSLQHIHQSLSWPHWGKRVVLGIIVAFCMAPVFTFHYYLITHGYTSVELISPAYSRALSWLRGNTEDPGSVDVMDPGAKPRYGIMNTWDTGHWVIWLAKRAPIANNFGSEPDGHRQGLRASNVFFTTSSAETAAQVLRAHSVKYVLSEHLSRKLNPLRSMLGKGAVTDASEYFRTISVQLHYFNGSAALIPWRGGTITLTGLDHYRLAYQSHSIEETSLGISIPEIKIFEYVPGAQIVLPQSAEPPYEIHLWFSTPDGSRALFKRIVTKRRRSVSVPYGRTEKPGEVSLIGGVAIKGKNWEGVCRPRLDDVRRGRRIKAVPSK